MKRIIAIIALALLADAIRAGDTVTVASLNADVHVIGLLGHPLGQILTVRCTGVAEPAERTKDNYWTRSVRVMAVNGVTLKSPVVIIFTSFPWAEVPLPHPAETITVIGYETGGFTGIPNAAFKYIPAAQSTDHFFQTYFHALRKEQTSEH